MRQQHSFIVKDKHVKSKERCIEIEIDKITPPIGKSEVDKNKRMCIGVSKYQNQRF